ncbi:LysR substrate-binding domain-containing protein [Aeromonas cavernicola]|uniref:LysR family transcriptional regulator n=1 Tax=Aeromonas cavernicola TaxID=1006623 RepID=A0A2H9U2M6_9GAMM|nr:LysR substrate-binding domain-containing protein [Aeromonas cavernicola]PJG58302.1 LysR family transcriptional regulator [Aeromonas cavernicola]
MELRQLEYFIRVAELGSFSRAAILLDVAQPALSRQVRLLELELKQHLLLRNGRGVTPTESGKLLLEHGRGILHQIARAREELGRVQGSAAGEVILGLPPSLLNTVAVPLVTAFRQCLPHATLSIAEGLSRTMMESLLSGRIDVALLYNTPASSDVEVIELLEEELFLITPKQPAPPLTSSLTEVATLPLLIPQRPNSIRMYLENELAKLGLRPHIAMEIDGISAILDLVANGAGCAVLTRNALRCCGHPDRFTLVSITGPSLRIRLTMAVTNRHPLTLTQERVMTLLRTNIPVWLTN